VKELLGKMIITRNLPFRFIEDPFLFEIINIINPDFLEALSSDKTIRKLVVDLHAKYVNDVIIPKFKVLLFII
jgi:hypothetical protein